MAEAALLAVAHPGAASHNQLPSQSEEHQREAIAIVGMHGRLPGARTLADYWDNLAACRDCTGPAPDSLPQGEHIGFARRDPGVAEGGFIEDVDAF
ncbi:beta-ketoacyl synthase N-terminal-like domain-containing protein, partial [Rhizobiaceae sp. 2RAB30]